MVEAAAASGLQVEDRTSRYYEEVFTGCETAPTFGRSDYDVVKRLLFRGEASGARLALDFAAAWTDRADPGRDITAATRLAIAVAPPSAAPAPHVDIVLMGCVLEDACVVDDQAATVGPLEQRSTVHARRVRSLLFSFGGLLMALVVDADSVPRMPRDMFDRRVQIHISILT